MVKDNIFIQEPKGRFGMASESSGWPASGRPVGGGASRRRELDGLQPLFVEFPNERRMSLEGYKAGLETVAGIGPEIICDRKWANGR